MRVDRVSRPGVMGKPIPGHVVGVIAPNGAPCRPGEIGENQGPDPVMFLSYWGNPDATREKFIGDWMTTGDQEWWTRTGTSRSSATRCV
jgi:acetyl-CoA synthetase